MIVDAHAHVFPEVRGMTARGQVRGRGFGRVSIGTEVHQLMPPAFDGTAFTTETLLASMDWAGVDKAVLLQGPFYGECNEYVAAACRAHADRLVGVAYLDPWSTDARAAFDSVAGKGIFKGLKLECTVDTGLLGLHPGARLDEDSLSWLWDALERLGWALVLDLGKPGSASYQTGAARAIAASHPRLRTVIAHLWQPGPWLHGDARAEELWREQVSLARLANVWLDTAALPNYHPEDEYPWARAAASLRRAVEMVGARKILWGTDIPGLLPCGTYPQLRRHVEHALAFLPGPEREAIFGASACEVFGITPG